MKVFGLNCLPFIVLGKYFLLRVDVVNQFLVQLVLIQLLLLHRYIIKLGILQLVRALQLFCVDDLREYTCVDFLFVRREIDSIRLDLG